MSEPDTELMMDIDEVCRFFGGSKPLDKSTVYRWVREKRIPASIQIGPQTSRWKRSELQQYVEEVTKWRRK